MPEYLLDMAFAIVFATLKNRGLVVRYEKAFFKLYQALGHALELDLIGGQPVRPSDRSIIPHSATE